MRQKNGVADHGQRLSHLKNDQNSHSSGVSSDPDGQAGWSKDFIDEVNGGSAIEDHLAASWAPSQVYNKSKGNVSRLEAQGRACINRRLM